jgi:hypothetical protein
VAVALVRGSALGLAGVGETSELLYPAAPPRFKAVAFDYFVLFNPDSIVSDVDGIFPGKGRLLDFVLPDALTR